MPSAAVCSTCGEIAVRRAERTRRRDAWRGAIPRARPASTSARPSATASATREAPTTAAFIELPTIIPATGTRVRPSSATTPSPNMMARPVTATRPIAARATANSLGTAGARRATVTAEKTVMPTTHSHDHTSGVDGRTIGTRATPTTAIWARLRARATRMGRPRSRCC